MDETALPSKKPRFDARLDFEIAEAADKFCEERSWTRGRLIKEAIAQYVDENVVIVPLEPKDQKKLEELARKHNRPTGYEAREAITQYLKEQSKEN